MNGKLLHGELTQEILGAFFTVYNELGHGFLESVYKKSMVVELDTRGITVRREVATEIVYLGRSVGYYRIDLLVADRVLVEVKASTAIGESDKRQLFNYLRASKISVGLLLNFGPKPEHKRFVWSGNQFNSQS